jgi:ABC-type glycerol-3-phosphate transport system permease component
MRHAGTGWSRAQKRRRRKRGLLIGFALVVFLLPLLWTTLASVGITPRTGSYPPAWSSPYLDGYEEVGVAERGFWSELATSALTSSASTVITIVVGLLASFSLVHSRLRRKRHLAQAFLVLASIPVMAYVIPLNGTITTLSLHDSFAGVSLAQATVFIPLAFYVLFGYLAQSLFDFEEAARLEGASALQTLIRIVVPVNAPALAATAIIVFVLNWNSFLAPMVLSTSHVRTIPIAMSDFLVVDRELDWTTAAAAIVVSLLPLLLFVAVTHRVLQRFFLCPTHEGGETA